MAIRGAIPEYKAYPEDVEKLRYSNDFYIHGEIDTDLYNYNAIEEHSRQFELSGMEVVTEWEKFIK